MTINAAMATVIVFIDTGTGNVMIHLILQTVFSSSVAVHLELIITGTCGMGAVKVLIITGIVQDASATRLGMRSLSAPSQRQRILG